MKASNNVGHSRNDNSETRADGERARALPDLILFSFREMKLLTYRTIFSTHPWTLLCSLALFLRFTRRRGPSTQRFLMRLTFETFRLPSPPPFIYILHAEKLRRRRACQMELKLARWYPIYIKTRENVRARCIGEIMTRCGRV